MSIRVTVQIERDLGASEVTEIRGQRGLFLEGIGEQSRRDLRRLHSMVEGLVQSVVGLDVVVEFRFDDGRVIARL